MLIILEGKTENNIVWERKHLRISRNDPCEHKFLEFSLKT